MEMNVVKERLAFVHDLGGDVPPGVETRRRLG